MRVGCTLHICYIYIYVCVCMLHSNMCEFLLVNDEICEICAKYAQRTICQMFGTIKYMQRGAA